MLPVLFSSLPIMGSNCQLTVQSCGEGKKVRRERRGNKSVVVSDCMTVDKSILLRMLVSKTQNEMYF